jgi:hypothetical protein
MFAPVLVRAVVMTIAAGSFFYAAAVEFSAGPKAGLGISSFWGKDAKVPEDSLGLDGSARVGFAGGGVFAAAFNEYVAGQLEVLYVMKGKKYSGSVTMLGVTATTESTMKLDYLEMPVLLKVSFPVTPVFKPSLFVGPSFAFLLSAKGWSKATVQNVTHDTTVDIKDENNTFDVGLAMGAGAEIKAGPGSIVFDIRYTLGFITNDKETADDKTNNIKQEEVKNTLFTIMVGYLFDF